MLLNTEDVYFFVPKDGATKDIKDEYSEEIKKFDEIFYGALKDAKIPVNKENSELLTNPGSATLAGIKVKGKYEFYKREWMRVQGDFYYPKSKKMSNDKWTILKKICEIRIPSKAMFNLMLLGIDKFESHFDNDVHLVKTVLEIPEGQYVKCSRGFFKKYFDYFPKDFEIIRFDKTATMLCKENSENYFNMANPKQEDGDKSRHPMDKYKISIEEFNGKYIIDMFSEPIDYFRIAVDSKGSVKEVSVESMNSELNTTKLRVACVLEKFNAKIKDKNCMIKYHGKSSDDVEITEYVSEYFNKYINPKTLNKKDELSDEVSSENKKSEDSTPTGNVGATIEGSVGEISDKE